MDNELKRLPNRHLEDTTWEKYYGKYHKNVPGGSQYINPID